MRREPYSEWKGLPRWSEADVLAARKGDGRALERVCAGTYRLLMGEARAYRLRRLDEFDTLGFAWFGLFRAVDTYDSAKGPFIPWLLTCVRSTMQDAWAAYGTLVREPGGKSRHVGEFVDEFYRKPEERRDGRVDFLEEMFSALNEQERFVVSMRFGIGCEHSKTLETIGDLLHLSRQRILQVERRALGKMRKRYATLARRAA